MGGSTSIPRRKGEFDWPQFAIFRELGVRNMSLTASRAARTIWA